MFEKYDDFAKCMDATTASYGSMVLDSTSKSNEIEECVFWYRANVNLPEFKLGRSIYWKLDKKYKKNDPTEEQAHPPSLDLIKENIGVYLQAFYDNKLLINNAYDTNMHTSVKGEFVKSLVHDNIDTNNLVGSLGVFKYEKNPSINENAEMEPIQGGEDPSTPPHPSSYKSIDTPAKEILKFEKFQNSSI